MSFGAATTSTKQLSLSSVNLCVASVASVF